MVDHASSVGAAMVRPARNQSETFQVEFGVTLVETDIDEDLHLLRAKLWMRYVSRKSTLPSINEPIFTITFSASL